MIKRPTFLGRAFTILLLFSVISHARTFVQQQDPKAVSSATNQVASTARTEAQPSGGALEGSTDSTKHAPEVVGKVSTPSSSAEKLATPPQTYTATAYSLRGRTASGRLVSRGLIAADPSVLPLGTRVRLEAGSFSGEYVVADTGGLVRGRRIDIWTPTSREAMQFGRRAVKLTILSLGSRRPKNDAVRSKKDKNTIPSPEK